MVGACQAVPDAMGILLRGMHIEVESIRVGHNLRGHSNTQVTSYLDVTITPATLEFPIKLRVNHAERDFQYWYMLGSMGPAFPCVSSPLLS